MPSSRQGRGQQQQQRVGRAAVSRSVQGSSSCRQGARDGKGLTNACSLNGSQQQLPAGTSPAQKQTGERRRGLQMSPEQRMRVMQQMSLRSLQQLHWRMRGCRLLPQLRQGPPLAAWQ